MLMRAIVSGLGDRRISSGRSRIGDEGADDVNGKDDRFSGSGRLKGAGEDVSVMLAGKAGKRKLEIGTSLHKAHQRDWRD